MCGAATLSCRAGPLLLGTATCFSMALPCCCAGLSWPQGCSAPWMKWVPPGASVLRAQQEPHALELISGFFFLFSLADLSLEFSRPAVLLYYPHATYLSRLSLLLPASLPSLCLPVAELLPASKNKARWWSVTAPAEPTASRQPGPSQQSHPSFTPSLHPAPAAGPAPSLGCHGCPSTLHSSERKELPSSPSRVLCVPFPLPAATLAPLPHCRASFLHGLGCGHCASMRGCGGDRATTDNNK